MGDGYMAVGWVRRWTVQVNVFFPIGKCWRSHLWADGGNTNHWLIVPVWYDFIFNFIFLTSKQLDGSLFAEEHSLATTGSPVAFQIVFTLFGIWWGSPHPLSSGSGGVSTWILWWLFNHLLLSQLWWRSTFGGVQHLVEIYFWWSSSSGGALLMVEFFFTQLQLLPSGGDFFSPTTAAVLTCPLWWSFVCGIIGSHSCTA